MAEWQSMSIDEVIKELHTNHYQGLSAQEAQHRLEEYGPNEVTVLKNKGENRVPGRNLKGAIAAILSFAVLISILVEILFGT